MGTLTAMPKCIPADVTKVKQVGMSRVVDIAVAKQIILVKNVDIYEMGELFTEQIVVILI